jgi:hypothetical protein
MLGIVDSIILSRKVSLPTLMTTDHKFSNKSDIVMFELCPVKTATFDSEEEEKQYRREIKSEERRAVIWLGILAIVVAFDVYLRGDRPPEVFNTVFFYNFFCNSPCTHITLFWVPFLDSLIYYWIGYAICIAIYFSEDFFPGRLATKGRRLFRVFGHFLLSFYPLTVGVFLLLGIGAVYLPAYLQSPNVYLAFYIIGRFVIWIFEAVTGQRRTVRRLLESEFEGFRSIWELVIEGLLPILERGLKRLSRGKIPPKLRLLWLKIKRFLDRRRKRKIRYWNRPKQRFGRL